MQVARQVVELAFLDSSDSAALGHLAVIALIATAGLVLSGLSRGRACVS